MELDLFAEFDRVCRKHGIKYVASGGTMLGAVRHHGFIPWDDDMDLMIMRDEYDKLCKIASEEFKEPYFFQSVDTDKEYLRAFARLRNSETTAIQPIDEQLFPNSNMGIFIDIFPLDHVADNKALYNFQIFQYKLFHKPFYDLSCYLIKHHLPSSLGLSLNSFARWLYVRSQKILKKYNSFDTEYVSLISFQPNNLTHALHQTDMEDLIEMDFEFMKIPVPANFDDHLKRKYGDYMTPVKSPNYHGEVEFDTNVSYKIKRK